MIQLAHWQAALAFLTGKTEHDAEYQDALFWADRPEWRPLGARDLYSCGLVARAALRLAGADVPPPLGGPYEGRNDVIARLVGEARRLGALRNVTAGEAQEPGRILVIGRNGDSAWSAGGAPVCEHVVCTYADGESDLYEVCSVEGGQRDAQGVDSAGAFRRDVRMLRGRTAQPVPWLMNPGTGAGRRIGYVIDALAWPAAEK